MIVCIYKDTKIKMRGITSIINTCFINVMQCFLQKCIGIEKHKFNFICVCVKGYQHIKIISKK